MKTVFLMCGISFSGKSTLAKAMVRALSCPLISLDDINQERGLGFGGEGIPVIEWERTHQIAMDRLVENMKSGADVVVDDTNCFRWLRDRFRLVAAGHNYRTVVVFTDVPPEVLRKRRERNKLTCERRGVNDDIFQELSDHFEVPAPDELTLVFSSTDRTDDWIESKLRGAAA